MTRYAPSSDGRIAYQIVGDGPIDIIVAKVYQLPIDLMWYEPRFVRFLDRMSSFSRHIWFDLRGSGSSDRVPVAHGRVAESVVDDMLNVLGRVGWDQAVVLGLVPEPLLFAASHPERTRALVLYNPTARFRWAEDYHCGFSDTAMEEPFRGHFRDQWGAVAYHARFAPSLSDDVRFQSWLARCERLGCPPDEGVQRLMAAGDLDVREVLPLERVPTLVVTTTSSGRRLAAQSRYVADHIEGSKTVATNGDGLFLVNEALLDAVEEFVTGRLPVHDVDRVLATVLFTDLVGSTQRAAALGDRHWREVLDAHDGAVRGELERFRGKEVNTVGDGFLATFDGPGRAIRCGCAIRDALRTLGLELRVGLHTGEIEVRGDDVAGVAVHIGARVAALAGPGEVVVSGSVPPLVAGSGIEFEDRGEHDLKGVPGSWRLFKVVS